MFVNQHVNHPVAKRYREAFRAAAKRGNGAAERIAAAQAKRDRKNVKRAEDAALSDQGQVWARLRKFDKVAA
jgi:hypothetical protein